MLFPISVLAMHQIREMLHSFCRLAQSIIMTEEEKFFYSQNTHLMAEKSKEKTLGLHEATSGLTASLPKNISFEILILELLSIVDSFGA